jgi:aminotransferase
MSITHQICTKTIMDQTDPDIYFDADGVCNHYHSARARLDAETYTPAQGQAKLAQIVERIKEGGKDKPYDCVLGLSGGADSSYAALRAKELGLRPLAVHLDNGWNTDTAVSNIELILRKFDMDLLTHVVRWDQFRDIQRALFMASVANVEVATDHAIFALLYNTAAKYNIEYVLSGTNLETEVIMPDSWGYDARDSRHVIGIKDKLGSPSVGIDTYPTLSAIKFARHIFISKVKFIPILNYDNYVKSNAVKEMQQKFGYRSYLRKHGESKFTRFFQEYYLPQKFNIDKRKAHFSSQIVAGTLSRDDALELLKRPLYDPDELEIDIEYITKKLGFSREDWASIMAAKPKSFKDYPNNSLLFDHNNPLVRKLRDFAKRG